jgi:hypothetical protein
MNASSAKIWPDLRQALQSVAQESFVDIAVQAYLWKPRWLLEKPCPTKEQFQKRGKDLEAVLHREIALFVQAHHGRILRRPKETDYQSDAFRLELPAKEIEALLTLDCIADIVSMSLAKNYFRQAQRPTQVNLPTSQATPD